MSRLTSDFTSALKPSVFLPVRRSIWLLEADEGAAADEQDVGGVDLEELLVRVLASALWRHVGDRAFENLEERLLDAFTRDVAGDRRVFVLAADLVDFVDVDDALLALLDVAAGGLQQLEDDVLDVLAHEITLRGQVLPVGGIKEKVLAAKRAGLRELILCWQNEKDVQDINPEYIKGVSFHYVKTLNQVIDLALVN